MFTIYLITNKLNGKIYVGQTKTGLRIRWRRHCSEVRKGSSRPICKALRKYGPESFTIVEIATADTQQWADYLEGVWILLYNSRNRKVGYNIRPGGNTAAMAEPTKELLSAASKKAWEEGRLKGYPHTQETKDRISALQKAGGFCKKDVLSEEVWSLWNSGVSVKSLSDHFSITTTTVYERIKQVGLPYRPFSSAANRDKSTYRRNAPIDMETARELRSSGASYDTISKQLGCSKTTVIRRLKPLEAVNS